MVETTASKPTSWRAGVELVVTALFWGIWIYFILPLVSLMMWLAGIFIFVDHMIVRGGYQSFLDQLLEYGLVILGMMAITLVWINWNIRRYGSSNKRSRPPQPVTHQETADFAGVSPETIKALHRRRHTVVYFDDHDRLVVANASTTPRLKRSRDATANLGC